MKHASITPERPVSHEVALFAQRRAAIDLVATSRARAIRAALFGSYLYRVNPKNPEDEATRAQWRLLLREQVDALTRACELISGRDPERVIPQEVCKWMGTYGAHRTGQIAAFVKMRDLTQRLVDAVEGGSQDQVEAALKEHFVFGRGGFFETVSDFCDGLWADLDLARHAEVEKAAAAGSAISKTLQRLEHIGKHVRLVSLNASVEASRVGDAGRGLGVIAVEFKTLAEEIQMLATTARSDIASMTQQNSGNATYTETKSTP